MSLMEVFLSELILAPDELIEKWNNLTLANNFLFTKVMQNEEICRHTLELLLNIKIKKLEYTHSEVYFKDSYDSRGIRFDVYTTDDKHCYDIEMQTTNKSNCLECSDLPDDETTKVFYNISQFEKHPNKEVRTFFEFIRTNKPADSFTHTLSKYAAEAKQNADYRRQYMRIEVELSDKYHEGIA